MVGSRLLLVALIGSVFGASVSNMGVLMQSCASDTNCKALDWGLRKLESGNEVPDTRDGKCCKATQASSGVCYLEGWYVCHAQADVPDVLSRIACKEDDKPCGSACCDRTEHRCEEYKDTNDFTRKQCVKKFNRRITFWIVALPIVMIIFMLAGIGLAVMTARGAKGMPAKVAILLSLVMSIFSILFLFSGAWKYAVVILGTSVVGIGGIQCGRSGVAGQGRPVAIFFVLALHLFLCLALLGWGDKNIFFGGWAEGILSDNAFACSPKWEGWFNRDGMASGKWTNAVRAMAADKDYHRIGKPWGYCDEEWIVTLRVFGAIEIALSWLLLMIHLANALWVPVEIKTIPTTNVGPVY